MAQTDNIKLISNNKKAYHDYFVDETYEAGIALFGTEVKSIRQGKINLKDSWCFVKDGETEKFHRLKSLLVLTAFTAAAISAATAFLF